MGDGDPSSRVGNMKALLGILAGAGASYGIYKLVSGGSLKKTQKSVTSEAPVGKKAQSSEAGAAAQPGSLQPGSLKPGSLLAKVSGLDVVCPRPEVASGNHIAEKILRNMLPRSFSKCSCL